MNKEELRLKYKALRDNLDLDRIDDLSLEIANQALQLPIWDKVNYHLFLSIRNKKEIDTEYLLQILAGKDKNTILSKSDFKEGTLSHYLLTDNTTIKVNSYGIPEPIDGIQVSEKQLDVVFIPLLAYDKQGNRIGYGKGFYDRFLAECKPNVIKVGLSFFPPEDHISDVREGDIPLDYCITPTEVYRF
ncbi:5-formyltetrahydrofolate cyclo-ligase [Myroides profundi]|uniref:5-formyltetrahydrofolate cyclo-ligase n=1 Tax=Myroides profundi TaxID=480520 RepID=A0AAJ4W0W3_MYRPR|nr:5-formyltetrahydrofolate cyclo-ligase [Myroides profundi]AJH13380.1 5-formyltetrahydrofolate cyclo-ligase [Myroides profundi]SEQ01883.1 5-formyltetrahydrofolate cyclo-ligase [Myroides profundi]